MHSPQVLNIDTIKGSWSDNDHIMLHACFKLLTDCIENEHLLNNHVDWSDTAETIQARQEIETLYNWWKERLRKELADEIDPIWTKNQYEEDNRMLIRLINIRKYLWT